MPVCNRCGFHVEHVDIDLGICGGCKFVTTPEMRDELIKQACNGCGKHVPFASLAKGPKGYLCVECQLKAVAIAEEMRRRKTLKMIRERKQIATHDWGWDQSDD